MALRAPGKASQFLHGLGAGMGPFWLSYGLYMAAVEAACTGHCCAGRNYNSAIGIVLPINVNDLIEKAAGLIDSIISGWMDWSWEAPTTWDHCHGRRSLYIPAVWRDFVRIFPSSGFSVEGDGQSVGSWRSVRTRQLVRHGEPIPSGSEYHRKWRTSFAITVTGKTPIAFAKTRVRS